MRKGLREQIVDSILKDYVISGRLAQGDHLPSVRQLQQKYGVASGTVVGAEAILQARGIIEVRRGSGCYIVNDANASGQNAGGEESKRIGLICNARDEFISIRLATGVDSICSRSDYTVVIAATRHDYEEEHTQVQRLLDSGCQGLVIYPCVRTIEQARKDYLNSEYLDIPIVLVDMGLPEHNRPQVLFDNYRVGMNMTRYLLEKGHNRIAFMDYTVGGTKVLHRSVADRYKGYLACMQDAGLPILSEDRWMLNTGVHLDASQDIAQLLLRWLEQVDRPTALIALEDSHASSTILLAQEVGIRVPEDLEIAGFDDLPLGRGVRPSFTTTGADFARAGEVAADMLLQMIGCGTDHNTVYMLPVPLLKRSEYASIGLEAGLVKRPADELIATVWSGGTPD